jgi:DNA polymerase I
MTDSFSEWQKATEWIDEPDPTIKGFEYVRSDVAQVTRDVQYDIFVELLTTDNPKEHVFATIESYIDGVMNGDIPLNDFGKRFGMSKEPDKYGSPERTPMPWYRGAKYANEFIYGTDAINSSSDPIFFYIDTVRGEYRTTYKAETAEDGTYVDGISVLDGSDLPDAFVVDRRKMVEKTILAYVRNIVTSMGWDVSRLESYLDDVTPSSYWRDDGQVGLDADEFM